MDLALPLSPTRLVARTAWIVAQLVLLCAAMASLDTGGDGLVETLVACGVTFVALVHAPIAWHGRITLAASLLGGAWIVARSQLAYGRADAALLAAVLFVAMAAGLALLFLWILAWRAPATLRVAALLAVAAALAGLRARGLLFAEPQWRIVGALFMFRLLVYAYEVIAGKRRERWQDGLNYLLLLPSFHFLLFPVVDYATFKRSRAPDLHATAQRGLAWIARGVVQLAIYRLLYHRVFVGPDQVRSFGTLCLHLFPAYLMYTNVSGQFHVIVGLLHLMGWRLPETNRGWLLASSFTDFWRRINVYWKEFMVRLFWFPTWFRLRKRGERLALTVATVVVFVATTLLHSWQSFWLSGTFALRDTDFLFWGVLGAVVLVGVLREQSRPKAAERGITLARVASTLGVWLTISLLWSMWSSPSVGEWLDTLAWWRRA